MMNRVCWQRIIALLLSLCLCAGLFPVGGVKIVSAAAETEDTGWQYRICEDGFAQVTGYTGTRTNLQIPQSLGGAWVVRVAQGALTDVDAGSIEVPAAVGEIPDGSLPAGAVIHAANGTRAHELALAEGRSFVNLSEYDLYDDILDLSEMPASLFSVTGNQLILSDPYARLVKPGTRMFLPPVSGYAHGLPVKAEAVQMTGSAAQVTFSELGFMDTLESYSVDDLLLTPDYSRAEILTEGFTLLSAAPRGATFGNESVFGIDFRAPNGFSIAGSLTLDVSYTVDLDMKWLEVQSFSYDSRETYKADLKFTQTSNIPLPGKLNDKFTFARIPLASAGLVTAWLEAALVVQVEGSIAIEYTVTFNESCQWNKGDAKPRYTHSKTSGGSVTLAVAAGAEVQANLTMSAGFKTGNLCVDFAQLTAGVGAQIKVESNTQTPDCADVSMLGKAGLTLRLGVLNADTVQVALNLKLLDVSWTIKKWHAETLEGPVKWVAECTQTCTISLCSFMETEQQAVQMLRGTTIASKLPRLSRNGYTFTGWYLDSACTQPLPDDQKALESMTVYAGWVANTPTPPPTATPAPTPTPTLIPPTPVPTNSLEDLAYLEYKIVNDETVKITGYTDKPYSLVIPSRIEGLPVTEIGTSAFKGCTTLTSVEIPGSVEQISAYAFQDCTNLTSITLHEGIRYIDSYAFNFCPISSLSLPDSIESFGAASFGNNDKLRSVTLPVSLKSTNSTYSAFSGCDMLTSVTVPYGMVDLPSAVLRNMDSVTSVYLPSSLRSIGYRAFMGCNGLSSISLPSGLTSLGGEAFNDCKSLKRITIPSGVTVIPQHCFSGCDMLQSITLPDGLKEIGLCAFNGSQMLESLHLPDSVESLGGNAIGNNPQLSYVNIPLSLKECDSWPSPFEGNPKLTSMTVPQGMTHLPGNIFSNMDSLMHVSLPSSLRSIGSEAFESCDNLLSLSLPAGLETIGTGAFQKSGLTSLIIPDNVTHLPEDMVSGCQSLSSLSLPEGLVSIGLCAINGCPGLTTLHIPDSVRTMGANAIGNNANLYSVNVPVSLQEVNRDVPPYYNCPSLTRMVVPEGMEALPAYLFDQMSSLTSVSLPSTLRSIGTRAFSGTNLFSLTLPDGLESIGSYAFAGCKSIPSVHIPGTVKQIGSYAFEDNKSLSKLTMEEGVETIGSYAFYECDMLFRVTLPDSVTTLNDRAFGSCDLLESINIPLSLTNCSGYYGPFTDSGIRSITVPDGLIKLPDRLFMRIPNLKELYLPSTLQTIGKEVFDGTTLTTVRTPVRGSLAASYFASNYPAVEVVVAHEDLAAINFNSRGGTPVGSRYVPIGAGFSAPDMPQRDACLFTGWYTDERCTKAWDFTTGTAPASGLTLYAGWDESYLGFVFEISGGTASIVAYNGISTSLTLPEHFTGVPVTRLCTGAISDGVEKVHIPASLTNVEAGAFRYASDLETITVADGHPVYHVYSYGLYTNDGTLHAFPRSRWSSTINVEKGTHTIGAYALSGNGYVRTINLPEGVTTLEASSIADNDELTAVSFKEDPASIGALCFTGCPKLRIGGPVGASVLTRYADRYGLRYNDYELTFQDGSTKLGTVRVRAGSLLDAPEEPTVIAYSFLGWSASNSASNLWNFATGVMPEKNMTLYTVWSLDYTVTPVDGGVALSGYTGGRNPVLVPEEVDGLAVVSIAEGTFPDTGVTLQGNKGSVTHAFAEQTGMTFVPLTYTVTFVSNGGTTAPAQTLCATDPVEEPAVYRSGYTFSGWYTDAALTTPWDFAASRMSASDLTLYAGWTADEGAVDVPFTWKDNGQGLTITGYTGGGGDITIPQTINGQTVTAIAPYAFSGLATLRSVTLPDTVTDIGAFAFAGSASLITVKLPAELVTISEGLFAGCTYLQQLTLPGGITSIGRDAFSGCSHLTGLTIGKAVGEIGSGAFNGCASLTALQVEAGNLYFTDIGGVLFSADGTRLLCYPQGRSAADYTVPDGVLSIGDEAMAYSRIRSLTLPASLAAIGSHALRGSHLLHTVTFADGSALSVIGAGAFTNCVSLGSIHLPQALTLLEANAFSGCNLTSVTIPAGTVLHTGAIPAAEGLCITGTVGSDAQRYARENSIRFIDPAQDIPVTGATLTETLTLLCGGTETLVWQLLPANTTETHVTFSSSDTAVATVDAQGRVTGWRRGRAVITLRTADGSEAYCTVTVLEANAAPTSVALSRESVSLVAGVSLPVQVTLEPFHAEPTVFWSSTDENVAFVSNGCIIAAGEGDCTLTVTTLSGLTASCTVTVYPALTTSGAILPASLTHIEEEAFRGTTLTALRLPAGVISIGSFAFADCLHLEAVSIPASVTQIADDAFNGSGAVVIYGQEGSVAEQYAMKHGLGFAVEVVGE